MAGIFVLRGIAGSFAFCIGFVLMKTAILPTMSWHLLSSVTYSL